MKFDQSSPVQLHHVPRCSNTNLSAASKMYYFLIVYLLSTIRPTQLKLSANDFTFHQSWQHKWKSNQEERRLCFQVLQNGWVHLNFLVCIRNVPSFFKHWFAESFQRLQQRHLNVIFNVQFVAVLTSFLWTRRFGIGSFESVLKDMQKLSSALELPMHSIDLITFLT